MRLQVAAGIAVCLASPAWGGEIIIVDPAREKAQSLPQTEKPRHDDLRERVLDESRGYLVEGAVPPAPTLIIKSGPPPSEATQAREKARTWAASPAPKATSRCNTENTVGGIEGTTQGHTVIQGNTSGVTLCK